MDNDQDELEVLEQHWKKQELREYKAYALQHWLEIYRDIVGVGGILPPTEDYRAVPVCVRRKGGFPVDVVAAQFDYDYADEFVAWIAGAHRTWQQSVDATEAPPCWVA